MLIRQAQEMMYRRAKAPGDLPWHREEPDRLLVKALDARAAPGRALDLGCGTGVMSAFMAKRGWQVTGLDFIPQAIAFAQARAQADGVAVDLVCADLLAWTPPRRYDLVLDSGCLHSLIGGSTERYKERLLAALAHGGDYVLGHWGRRHALDWRPVGPRRRTRAALTALLAPELVPVEHEEVLMTGIPLPFGPTVLGLGLWFRRG